MGASRVLWVPSYQAGSYFPAVPLALALAERGHALTVLCEAKSEETFRSLGFDFRATAALDAFLPTAEPPRDRETKLRRFAGYATALFADTSTVLADGDYDAVMFDPLEPGASFAAEAAGVRSLSYVHWKMDETGADVPFSFHLWDGTGSAGEAFVVWWNEMRALVGLGAESRPLSEHRWYRHSPLLTLILGLPELAHPQGELPPYAVRVGPLIWEPPQPDEAPSWSDSLGRQRPAVLASVSTVGRADTELISIFGDALAGEDVDVALTVPADGELPALPTNFQVARFVPHSLLLKRASIVICHGGNGIVTRAACAGVPVLLIPDGRDRFEVARGAVAAGLGISINRADIDPDSLRNGVRELLDDPRYAERAQSLATLARTYDGKRYAASQVETLLTPN